MNEIDINNSMIADLQTRMINNCYVLKEDRLDDVIRLVGSSLCRYAYLNAVPPNTHTYEEYVKSILEYTIAVLECCSEDISGFTMNWEEDEAVLMICTKCGSEVTEQLSATIVVCTNCGHTYMFNGEGENYV